jgi:hypothetical protein
MFLDSRREDKRFWPYAHSITEGRSSSTYLKWCGDLQARKCFYGINNNFVFARVQVLAATSVTRICCLIPCINLVTLD